MVWARTAAGARPVKWSSLQMGLKWQDECSEWQRILCVKGRHNLCYDYHQHNVVVRLINSFKDELPETQNSQLKQTSSVQKSCSDCTILLLCRFSDYELCFIQAMTIHNDIVQKQCRIICKFEQMTFKRYADKSCNMQRNSDENLGVFTSLKSQRFVSKHFPYVST